MSDKILDALDSMIDALQHDLDVIPDDEIIHDDELDGLDFDDGYWGQYWEDMDKSNAAHEAAHYAAATAAAIANNPALRDIVVFATESPAPQADVDADDDGPRESAWALRFRLVGQPLPEGAIVLNIVKGGKFTHVHTHPAISLLNAVDFARLNSGVAAALRSNRNAQQGSTQQQIGNF